MADSTERAPGDAPRDRRLSDDGRPDLPWGDAPPPAPATATRQERAAVRAAWSAWGTFRPVYTRRGAGVECEINLKDRIWRGYGEGTTDADAAWRALQDCIASWRRDVPALGCGPGSWLARRSVRRRRG